MLLAAKITQQIGPSVLLTQDPPPEIPLDTRVTINTSRMREISALIKNLSEVVPFNFIGDDYPTVGHPAALDFFFASIAQQFSFWETDKGKYDRPMIASIDGEQLKGSSYTFRCLLRQFEKDPSFFTPNKQAKLSREEFLKVFRSDDGKDPMPAFDLHLEFARCFGQDMMALDLDAQKVVARAKNSSTPLKTLYSIMDHVSGFKEDPLRKKMSLLALALSQRPEIFLTLGKEEQIPPVIDYHLMRSCLRTGIIEIKDKDLEKILINRELISPHRMNGQLDMLLIRLSKKLFPCLERVSAQWTISFLTPVNAVPR